MTPPDRPILLCIVGDSRCGSTLLQHLLASQPGVVALGEVRRLERFLKENRTCGCGVPIGECQWWHDLLRRAGMGGRTPATQPSPHRLQRLLGDALLLLAVRLGWTGWLAPWLARRRAAARDVADLALAAAGDAGLVIDSSKDPGHYATILLQDRIAVQPVVLLRDGRGVVWSQVRRGGADLVKAIRHWRRVMRATELLMHSGPVPPIVLRYEDVCRDPRAALASLLALVGRSVGEPGKPDLHVIGGSPDFRPSRLDALRVDERWREEMPAAMQARFERGAGRINRRLGAAA